MNSVTMETSVTASLLLLAIVSSSSGADQITPPTAGNWTVKDASGNPCMLVSFAAQYFFTHLPFYQNHIVNIGPSALVNGTCDSPNRTINLFPDPTNAAWKLSLGFTRNASSRTYAMTMLAASWPECPSCPPTDYYEEIDYSSNFLENNVTVGKAYACADKLIDILGDSQVFIWDMHLQPFAEEAGGTFGPVQQCGPPPPAGNWTLKEEGSGNTCMLLSFAAKYVIYGDGYHNRNVIIEPSSLPNSTCQLPDRLVDFFPDPSNPLWKLQLGFFWNSTDATYTMTKVAAGWPLGSTESLFQWVNFHNFLKNKVPLGKAYTCEDELSVDLGDAQVHIFQMHLQPFADYSGGMYGPEQRCNSSGPAPMTTEIARQPTTVAPTKGNPTKSSPPPSAPTKSAPVVTTKGAPTKITPTKGAPTKGAPTKGAPVVVIIVCATVGGALFGALVVGIASFVINYRKKERFGFQKFA